MNEFDFRNDLKYAVQTQFDDYGVKIPMQNDLYAMLLDYLTVHKKFIVRKPRKVTISPLLKDKLSSHSKKTEIEYLINLTTEGGDLNLFQSKKVLQTKFHDHLLYEWNIFHFHLSLSKEKKSSFVKQSDLMLFAYITENEAIFLDTEKHLPGIFADSKWIEILHDYFPSHIEQYLYKRLNEEEAQRIATGEHYSAANKQQLWDKGYTIGFTAVRGVTYFSPGVGRSTSGHSSLVVKTAGEIMRWLHLITEQFMEYHDQICSHLNLSENQANFKLHFGSRTIEIIETTSKTILLTYRDSLNTDLFLQKPTEPLP